MEGNLHSVAGETMHQTRPEGKKDKMHTSQTGRHLAHHKTTKGSGNIAGGEFLRSSRRYVWRTKCSKRLVQGQLLHWRRQGAGDSRHQGWLAPHCRRSNTPNSMEWVQLSGYWAANKEHILPANFANEHHMCWSDGPLCRQREAQKTAEGASQRNESNLHTAEDGNRMHGARRVLRDSRSSKKCFGTFLCAALLCIATHLQERRETFAKRRAFVAVCVFEIN